MNKIIWIIVTVFTLSLGIYFIFFNQSSNQISLENLSQEGVVNEILPDEELSIKQGENNVSEKGQIQIIYPKGGEKLEIDKSYDIRWENYFGTEPLTIALQSTSSDNKVSSKIITSNISPTRKYEWKVTSESPDNKYKIEVYPANDRSLVGISSDYFSISGEQLITSVSPNANTRVNATTPLIITGKAKKVFGEGEFDISASYILDNQKQVLAKTFAACNTTANDCDWLSGDLLDFKAILDLSAAPVCYVNVEFFKRDEKNPQKQPFYVLPLWLYGNESCK